MVIGEWLRRVDLYRLMLRGGLTGLGGGDGGKTVLSENRRSSKSWASLSNRRSCFDIFLLCSSRCMPCILLKKRTLSSMVGRSSNLFLSMGIGVSWWPMTIPSFCPIRYASSLGKSASSKVEENNDWTASLVSALGADGIGGWIGSTMGRCWSGSTMGRMAIKSLFSSSSLVFACVVGSYSSSNSSSPSSDVW